MGKPGGERVDTSDHNGVYAFAIDQTGVYTVDVGPDDSRVLISPSPVRLLGMECQGRQQDFAFYAGDQSSLCGVVWADSNPLSAWDTPTFGPEDVGWGPGVTLTLTGPDGFYTETTTTPWSWYCFYVDATASGRYTATLQPPTGVGVSTNPEYGFDMPGSLVHYQRDFGLIAGQGVTFTIQVYEDTDCDGVHDGGEAGLTAAWVEANGQGQQETDGSGQAIYTNLPAGPVGVWLRQNPDGYPLNTTPTYLVQQAEAGQSYTVSFGVQTAGGCGSGLVHGTVYSDTGCNSQRDLPDVGISSVTIRLRTSSGVSATTQTDIWGRYTFSDVMPGGYFVDEENLPGWMSTTPDRLTVQVEAGSEVQRDFGDAMEGTCGGDGAVVGLVFHDVARNGQLDPEDPGIAGAVVQVDGVGLATTDDAGGYGKAVPPSAYLITGNTPLGYNYATTLNPLTRTVLVDSSAVANFGFSVDNPYLPLTATKVVTDLTGGGTYRVGSLLCYDLALINGSYFTHTDIRIVDLLPLGPLTFSHATVSAGGTVFAPNPLNLTWDLLPPRSSVTASIYMTVTPAALGEVVTNTFEARSQQVGPVYPITPPVVGPVPDNLGITKNVETAGGGSVLVGERITYTIVVENLAPDVATGITISDTHPAGLDFLEATTAPLDDWTVLQVTPTYRTVFPRKLDAGRAITLTLVYTAARVGGSVGNTVAVTSSSQLTPVIVGPVCPSGGCAVQPGLAIDKTAVDINGYPLHVGDEILYEIEVQNLSQAVYHQVTISDPVPLSSTLASGGILCSPHADQCQLMNGSAQAVGTLASGATLTLTMRITVDPVLSPDPDPDWHFDSVVLPQNTAWTWSREQGMRQAASDPLTVVPRQIYLPLALRTY